MGERVRVIFLRARFFAQYGYDKSTAAQSVSAVRVNDLARRDASAHIRILIRREFPLGTVQISGCMNVADISEYRLRLHEILDTLEKRSVIGDDLSVVHKGSSDHLARSDVVWRQEHFPLRLRVHILTDGIFLHIGRIALRE